jgi:hypothetical protein
MSALNQKAIGTNLTFVNIPKSSPSTNIGDSKEGGKGGEFSTKKPKIKLIKGIPSKNPRNFDSEEEIDQYLGSLDIKDS